MVDLLAALGHQGSVSHHDICTVVSICGSYDMVTRLCDLFVSS